MEDLLMCRGSRAATFLTLTLIVFCTCMTSSGLAEPVDGDMFPVPEADAVTFWGHACIYIDVGGYGIVTDPVFEGHTVVRWRHVPAPPASSYAGTRLILISHAHPDHLSLDTIREFPPGAVILCPMPSERYISTLGREVKAVAPGDEFEFPGGRVVAVVARHAGTRYGIRSQTDGGALGFVIYTPWQTVYYSGDTSLFDGITEVGEVHAPDISILNICGHLHGEDAVEAARRLGSETVIPCHFGAYGYLFMPERKRPRDLDQLVEDLGDRVVLLGIGESYPLRRPEP
jgi:L-ascorbate metabolism protein UlaG (beta-lactamase superfamily)